MTVVTGPAVDGGGRSGRGRAPDLGLLESLPEGVRVLRTSAVPPTRFRDVLSRHRLLRLARLFEVPDPLIRWQVQAVRACQRLHRVDPVDCLLTSANPRSANVIGLRIATLLDLPWVAEFRDPWIQNPFTAWESRLHYVFERRLQRSIAERAQFVLMNTPVAREQLLAAESNLPPGKVRIATNGFDPIALDRLRERGDRADSDLVFTYVGNPYSLAPRSEFKPPLTTRKRIAAAIDTIGQYRRAPYEPLHRSLWFFMLGLRRALDQQPDLRKRVRVVQVGPLVGSNRDRAKVLSRVGLEGVFSFIGPVAHAEAVRHMARADVLLLTQLRPGDGSLCPCVASKTYEYLGLGKPILGMVPAGDMRDMLLESGRAVVVSPDDPEAIAEAVLTVSSPRWRRTISTSRDDAFSSRYSWEHISQTVWSALRDAVAVWGS